MLIVLCQKRFGQYSSIIHIISGFKSLLETFKDHLPLYHENAVFLYHYRPCFDECRFRLYSSWKGETIALAHPSLLRRRVDVIKKVKHLMRRISKENVKPMGRLLGKLSHAMPGIIFDYVCHTKNSSTLFC